MTQFKLNLIQLLQFRSPIVIVLVIIKERGIHDLVQVESGSALAIQIANSDCARGHQCYDISNQVVAIANQVNGVSCSYIFREANQVVDCFAKRGLQMEFGIHVFERPFAQVQIALLADLSIVSFFCGFQFGILVPAYTKKNVLLHLKMK